MKTKLLKSRTGTLLVLSKETEIRLKLDLCPVCAKPKSEWNRRKDWRCCSSDCTTKYHNGDYYTYFNGQNIRSKTLKRDNYTCVKCGKKAYEDYRSLPLFEYAVSHGSRFYSQYNWIDEDGRPFIADHIIPISIGGDEFDMKNLQTLCPSCNKIKTKKDMERIAEIRRIQKAFDNMIYPIVKGLITDNNMEQLLLEFFF
jgi:5-methylcytosine-specific restriction endonuclease McrA